MTVKAILSRKGYAVTTIEPKATLADAARILRDHHIGAVVVKGEGDRVAGLLSERDIVRAVADRGAEALAVPVEQAMTRRVVTCVESDAIGDIMQRMTVGKFRHLPVMEGERLVAIVSIGDVVKHRLEQVEAESSAMRDYIATA